MLCFFPQSCHLQQLRQHRSKFLTSGAFLGVWNSTSPPHACPALCGQMEIAQLSLFFYLSLPCPRLSHPTFLLCPRWDTSTHPAAGTSLTCWHNIPVTATWTQHELFLWLQQLLPSFHYSSWPISSWAALLFGNPWLYLTRSPNCLHWFYQRLILKAAQ